MIVLERRAGSTTSLSVITSPKAVSMGSSKRWLGADVHRGEGKAEE